MKLELVASGLFVVLAAPYLWHALRLPGWAPWRTAVHLASCALLWWCLAGTPAVLRLAEGSWGVVGVALADVLVGFGFVVAAPVRLWEEARGRRVAWIRSPLFQVLGFPLVSATVNGALIVAAFNTSWFSRSRSDDVAWITLIGACLLGGFLANLQLLSPDLVPAWMSPGARMVLGLIDGLLDELPGIIVMVTVNQVWGGILWVAAQPVVVPMILLIIIDWIRHDRKVARYVDVALDAIESAGGSTSTPWWITESSGNESGFGEPSAPHRPGD
jgi:putative copper resistance protein D